MLDAEPFPDPVVGRYCLLFAFCCLFSFHFISCSQLSHELDHLQASQLPWKEPSRGFNFSFPNFSGVNIDKLADDFKVFTHPAVLLWMLLRLNAIKAYLLCAGKERDAI